MNDALEGRTPGEAPAPPPTAEHLRVLAERVPAPSEVNDWIVLASAAVAALGGLVFGLGLLLGAPLAAYGSALAVALFALGLAVRRYVVDRFADVEALEPRPEPDDDDAAVIDVPALPRRRFLGRVLGAAAALLGLGLAAPIVSLGPTPGPGFGRTEWRRGTPLVTGDGEPIRPEDLAPGGVLTAWPQGAVDDELSAVMVVRVSGEAPVPPTNLDWVVDGSVVAYSKVCTHAGCPVALFRERDDALFCPCHQSTFDVRRAAIPTFGPAARALPQLPLGVEDGALVALGPFTEHVGPAFG